MVGPGAEQGRSDRSLLLGGGLERTVRRRPRSVLQRHQQNWTRRRQWVWVQQELLESGLFHVQIRTSAQQRGDGDQCTPVPPDRGVSGPPGRTAVLLQCLRYHDPASQSPDQVHSTSLSRIWALSGLNC